MAENLPISLMAGEFATGYCPANWQALANDIVTAITGTIEGNYTFLNFGSAEPSVENRDRPWIRTNSVTGIIEGTYTWNGTIGAWVRPYDVPASGNERRIWVGTISDLNTYDGGNANPVGDADGPFWQVDTDFDARIPMGVGTTAGSQVISLNTNYGADETTLVSGNLPEHFHYIAKSTQVNGGPVLNATHSASYSGGGAANTDYTLFGLDAVANPADVGQTSKAGTASPTELNLLNPVRGVYFIKRTARLYRRAV